MNKKDLLNILICLSHGVDPDSKKKLSEEHILNRPDVIRALYQAVNALQGRITNWTITEESMLLKYYYSDFELNQISVELNKSVESITLKLIELDIVETSKVA